MYRQPHFCKIDASIVLVSRSGMLPGFAPLRCRVSTVKYKLSSLAVGVDDEFALTTFTQAKPWASSITRKSHWYRLSPDVSFAIISDVVLKLVLKDCATFGMLFVLIESSEKSHHHWACLLRYDALACSVDAQKVSLQSIAVFFLQNRLKIFALYYGVRASSWSWCPHTPSMQNLNAVTSFDASFWEASILTREQSRDIVPEPRNGHVVFISTRLSSTYCGAALVARLASPLSGRL